MPYTHAEKKSGDLIRSADWNAMSQETVRLETDKVNRAGDTVKGELKVTGKFSADSDIAVGSGKSLSFADNGEIRSFDDKHRILFRRSENKLELRECGDIILSSGAVEGKETAKLVVKSDGNVGISGSLSVSGTLKANGVEMAGAAGRNYFKDSEKKDGTGLRVGAAWYMYGIYAEDGPVIVAGKDGVNFQNGKMTIPAGGNVGIGVADPKIHLAIGDNDTGLHQQGGGELAVYTNGAERLRVNAGGNIGIGTTTPGGQVRLHVLENVSSTNAWRGRVVAGGPKNAVVMGEFNDKAWLGGHNAALNAWSDLIINADPSTGNVGIGTDKPVAKLDVNGELRVSAAIKLNNSDIYFTKTDHNHSGLGNPEGFAAIENAKDYGALMILGRQTGSSRIVKIWDYLQVNGNLDVTGVINGSLVSSSGRYKLVMQNDRNLVIYDTGNGAVGWASGSNVSDIRLKRNIKPIENALSKLLSVRGISFNWQEEDRGAESEFGVAAQEVEKVFPELVGMLADYKTVKYNGLIPVLIEATKELFGKINHLQQELNQLKAEAA